ncbi:molecular chaperone [Proteus cibi]
MKNLIRDIILTFTLFMTSFGAYTQGVSLGKTRVIFSESYSESVTITNDDNKPYLIQAGVTTDLDGNLSPHFIVTPPIFRLENKSTSSMRILLKDVVSLPNDKESLFYLNTKIIPSTEKNNPDDEISKLVLITSFVIKVIYRPDSLSKPTDIDYRKIKLQNQGRNWSFNNPTPYYFTLTKITLNKDKYSKSIIIAPYSQTRVDVNNINKASWFFINDYGELSKEFHYKDVDK